jgi:hypothetical protein
MECLSLTEYRPFLAAGRAGERAGALAYRRGLASTTVGDRARKLARAYAARHPSLSPRVRVHLVYSYAMSFVMFYDIAAVEAGATQEAVEPSFLA